MVTLMSLPNELLLEIITFVTWPSCGSCTSTTTSPFHVYPLLQTNRLLHDLALPFLYRRICIGPTTGGRSRESRERMLEILFWQLQRPGIGALVQSVCLHTYSCRSLRWYMDFIGDAQLNLRSLCITRHWVDSELGINFHDFSFANLPRNLRPHLVELQVHSRRDIPPSEAGTGLHLSFPLPCNNGPELDVTFAYPPFRRLRQLTLDFTQVHRYVRAPLEFSPPSRHYFWWPETLEVLNLHSPYLCCAYKTPSTMVLFTETDFQHGMWEIYTRLLIPLFRRRKLHLKRLLLTFEGIFLRTRTINIEYILGLGYDPILWLDGLNSDMARMGIETLISVAKRPYLSTISTSEQLRDMQTDGSGRAVSSLYYA